MKVSVIIPVYNAARYLEECIASALNQTYGDVEVIAVDDGSTDESPHILEKFSQKITVISKKNGGTPSALNTGIKNMKGEWFKWLSADDVLNENAVEALMAEAGSLGEAAKTLIIYSNYDIINEKSEVVGEVIETDYNDLSPLRKNAILLDHFYGNGTASIMHKSVFERCGTFDESVGFKEDYEFWLRCCLLYGCTLHLLPQKLAKYRVHGAQLTRTKVRKNIEQVKMIKDYVLKKVPEAERMQLLTELKAYQAGKPLKIRIRRQLRDIMLRVLPSSTSGAIIETYMRHKD